MTAEVQQDVFEPAAEAPEAAPPPWALDMMDELQRLRRDNNELREALRGLSLLLGRQVDALREGREQLDRYVGDRPEEDAQ